MHYLYSVYFLKIRYDENYLDVYEWSIFKALSIVKRFIVFRLLLPLHQITATYEQK